MYYIGQEIIARINTLNYKEGDKIIIHRIDRNWLYDNLHRRIHINNVAPSFTAGDTVWDTHSNTTFVVHHIVDDQVYSITPVGSTDPSFLHGRPISRVRSLPIPAAPSTTHPDTERLDWVLGRLSWKITPVTREDIDRLRGKVDENGCYTREDGECVSSGQCVHSQKDDGWIPWSGGTCPVRENAVIEIELGNGRKHIVKHPQFNRWTHNHPTLSPGDDIVAYRLVK